MQTPAQKPQKRGLLPRVRAWLHRRRPRSVSQAEPQQLVMLPRQARLFGGRLMLSLPSDFRAERMPRGSRGIHCLTGDKTGLHLTVTELPFAQPLRRITHADLQIAFRRLSPPLTLRAVSHGFLRHSPMLTAEWGTAKKTVLRAIQVRKTVYLLYFENVLPENAAHVQAILYAASVAV